MTHKTLNKTTAGPSGKRPAAARLHLVLLACLLAALPVLAGCRPDDPAAGASMENISLPTPTPRPTATPVTPSGTDAPAAAGQGEDSFLGGILGGGEAPAAGEEAAPTPNEDPGEPDTPAALEPVEVAIDLRSGDLNTWIEVSPPPGWRIIQGLDGILLTQRPEMVPGEAFVMVRRWGNVVNLTDYLAYLPDAVEERNSNVAFRMGGYDWDGVFLTTEDHRYRAFFGISADGVPSFTLLVFVPAIPNENEEPLSREQLLASWSLQVGDLNSILRRFSFY